MVIMLWVTSTTFYPLNVYICWSFESWPTRASKMESTVMIISIIFIIRSCYATCLVRLESSKSRLSYVDSLFYKFVLVKSMSWWIPGSGNSSSRSSINWIWLCSLMVYTLRVWFSLYFLHLETAYRSKLYNFRFAIYVHYKQKCSYDPKIKKLTNLCHLHNNLSVAML